MGQFQFLGCYPLGVGAELVECPDFVAVEQRMEQQSEAAGAEQDQVFAAMHGQLREADYGNRRVLIVDAATGKYVGHFGAYGQNPVMGENGGGPDVGEGVSSWPAEFKRGEMKPKIFRSPVPC